MKNTAYYLGVDVGSVSTNLVVIDDDNNIIEKLYLRTAGNPIQVLLSGMRTLADSLGEDGDIKGVGTTGSGRQLASVIIGSDIIKNEITSHCVAAQMLLPGVNTILEIGGQDSKIIMLRNGIIYDFAMNTVCAAGTGSFLDRQASRLNIPIEEFGHYALKSNCGVRIAGRCAVFAESDMIHKQQMGHGVEDIIKGLCDALVRNYLSNLAKGKEIKGPVIFQGGVAANVGIVDAFQRELGISIVIPEHYDVMGAYGAALIAKDKMLKGHDLQTNFYGFESAQNEFSAKSTECNGCPNMCEVVEISSQDDVLACWGDRCGKWSNRQNVFTNARS